MLFFTCGNKSFIHITKFTSSKMFEGEGRDSLTSIDLAIPLQ
jgi:hypothetical protein